MIKHWTRFEGRPNGADRDQVRVTLSPKKVILLNRVIFEAMGEPAAVELLFDETRKVIGLQPIERTRRNAFPVKQNKSGRHRTVQASAFCTHFGITVDRTVQFQHVDLDSEGVLELDMAKTVTVGRGSR